MKIHGSCESFLSYRIILLLIMLIECHVLAESYEKRSRLPARLCYIAVGSSVQKWCVEEANSNSDE